MSGTAIVGTQFGDEGKGKVTDFYAKDANIVVRYQGGNNAGHTVCVKDKSVKLHHIPSGVMYGKKIMIGSGCVIDPRVLDEEIRNLEKFTKVDLTIDPRAHIIMPYHNLLDEAGEEAADSNNKIGTTKRGIGPCYADKASRSGIRFEDLINEKRLKEKLHSIFPRKKAILEKVYGFNVDFSEEDVFNQYNSFGKEFLKYVGDVSFEITEALDKGKKVLFEGAQGTFLDNDFGTYPYVTSSHPISGGIAIGVGIAINKVEKIIGIVKAYTTRVGGGPFPTELSGALAEKIREQGREYGTTTGRPRRVGWLDLPMLRTAVRLNGLTELAITKLDVLSNLQEVKIAESYEMSGKKLLYFPYSTRSVEKAKANYKTFKGFNLSGRERKFNDLPKEAGDYLRFIESELKVPIKLISVGPEREETILVK